MFNKVESLLYWSQAQTPPTRQLGSLWTSRTTRFCVRSDCPKLVFRNIFWPVKWEIWGCRNAEVSPISSVTSEVGFKKPSLLGCKWNDLWFSWKLSTGAAVKPDCACVSAAEVIITQSHSWVRNLSRGGATSAWNRKGQFRFCVDLILTVLPFFCSWLLCECLL